MRFRGGGVGHRNDSSLDDRLLADRNIMENDNTWQDELFRDFLDDNSEDEGEDPPADALITSLLSVASEGVPPPTDELGVDENEVGNGTDTLNRNNNNDDDDDDELRDDDDGLHAEDFE